VIDAMQSCTGSIFRIGGSGFLQNPVINQTTEKAVMMEAALLSHLSQLHETAQGDASPPS
jgi:hypothetical protein